MGGAGELAEAVPAARQASTNADSAAFSAETQPATIIEMSRLSTFLSVSDLVRSIVVLTTAASAVFGTLVINGFVGSRFVGKHIPNHWTSPLVDCLFYCAWFVILAVIAVVFLGPRPVRWLAVSAVLALACFVFVFPSPWVNPELSLFGKAKTYFISYVAEFTILPAFILVGIWTPWSQDN